MSSYITDDELVGIGKIRDRLGTIPSDLDTDFNLRRWWVGYHGRLDEIATNFDRYVRNRRALGFDQPDFIDTFFIRERPLLQYFSMSRIVQHRVNRHNKLRGVLFILKNDSITFSDNGIVFTESCEFDKNVVRVMSTSTYLRIFFGSCEYMLQLVLKQERETGQPSHGICICDIGKVDLSNHINPMSPCNKVFALRAIIWQDYYPSMIQRIVVVNPPFLLHVIWPIVRFLLNESARKLLHFAQRKDSIFTVLDANVVPVAFGGQLKDPSWSNRDDCCNDRRPITETDFYVDGSIWKRLHIEMPPHSRHIEVKPNRMCRYVCNVDRVGTIIAWHFRVNSEVEFGVIHAETGEYVYPKLKLVTTLVAEEDHVTASTPGCYYLDFVNPSHHFRLKLEIVLVGGVVSMVEDAPIHAA